MNKVAVKDKVLNKMTAVINRTKKEAMIKKTATIRTRKKTKTPILKAVIRKKNLDSNPEKGCNKSLND